MLLALQLLMQEVHILWHNSEPDDAFHEPVTLKYYILWSSNLWQALVCKLACYAWKN